MADQGIPSGTIPERLAGLLADWGADFSMFLKELEEKRALLQEFEAEAASQSNMVEALNRRIEAQDALIESLNTEADQTATLRKEVDNKDQELERKNSEIDRKYALIGALQRDAEGTARLKGDARVRDHEIDRLMTEKQHAEQHVAELTEEFKIFTASTLTGVDAVAELAAIRVELDARKSLIERYVSTIAELQQTVATWKEKYASLNSRNSSSEPPILTTLPELTEEELQSLVSVKSVNADHADATVAIDMRKALLEAQKVARSPEGLSSEPRSALNRAKTR